MSDPRNIKPYLYILIPSGMGIAVYSAVALIGVVVQSLLYSQQNYSYLDVFRLLGQDVQHFNLWLTQILSSTISAYLVLYLFWSSVGFIVYIILRYFINNVDELMDDFSLRSYIWPKGADKNKPIVNFAEEALFRLAVFIVVSLYFLRIIGYFLRSGYNGTSAFDVWLFSHGILKYFIIVGLEVIAMHGLIVLLRLLFLRARLFS